MIVMLQAFLAAMLVTGAAIYLLRRFLGESEGGSGASGCSSCSGCSSYAGCDLPERGQLE